MSFGEWLWRIGASLLLVSLGGEIFDVIPRSVGIGLFIAGFVLASIGLFLDYREG